MNRNPTDEMQCEWPEVFTDPGYDYQTKYPGAEPEQVAQAALLHGLCGWGTCHLALRPEGFGKGLLKIATVLKAAGLDVGNMQQEDLMRLTKQMRSAEDQR